MLYLMHKISYCRYYFYYYKIVIVFKIRSNKSDSNLFSFLILITTHMDPEAKQT